MVDLLMGDSGSFCHLCNMSRKDANELQNILQGFPIEKSFHEMKEIWKKLDSGEISYHNTARKGQCHEPIAETDIKFFAILHQQLRSIDLCLKLLYHIVSGKTETWSEAAPDAKAAIKEAKTEVINEIREKTGVLIDSLTSIGGNTNTGLVSDRFF